MSLRKIFLMGLGQLSSLIMINIKEALKKDYLMEQGCLIFIVIINDLGLLVVKMELPRWDNGNKVAIRRKNDYLKIFIFWGFIDKKIQF